MPGTLKFSPATGATLTTLRALRYKDTGSWPCQQIDTIHGTTAEEEFVTLCSCDLATHSQDARRTYKVGYDVVWVITGNHFETLDSVRFQKLKVGYSGLDAWALIPGFDVERDLDGHP